jgi:iron(III) transport system permease protein
MRDAGMMPQAAALGSIAIVLIIVVNFIINALTAERKGV